jgi:hypothetical protein
MFSGAGVMLDHIRNHRVTITIAVAFYVFGFFIVANVLHLSERDVVVGLLSGSICGVTTLVASLVQERRAFIS